MTELKDINQVYLPNDKEEVGYPEQLKRQVVISEYISITAALACCITSAVLIFQSKSSAAIALLTG